MASGSNKRTGRTSNRYITSSGFGFTANFFKPLSTINVILSLRRWCVCLAVDAPYQILWLYVIDIDDQLALLIIIHPSLTGLTGLYRAGLVLTFAVLKIPATYVMTSSAESFFLYLLRIVPLQCIANNFMQRCIGNLFFSFGVYTSLSPNGMFLKLPSLVLSNSTLTSWAKAAQVAPNKV